MQNEPNFGNDKMNVRYVTIEGYEDLRLFKGDENEPKTNPKRTQTNPNKPKQTQIRRMPYGTNPIFCNPSSVVRHPSFAPFGVLIGLSGKLIEVSNLLVVSLVEAAKALRNRLLICTCEVILKREISTVSIQSQRLI